MTIFFTIETGITRKIHLDNPIGSKVNRINVFASFVVGFVNFSG